MMNTSNKPSIREKPMSEANWIAATARLPVDGQAVLVKTANGSVEHRVTFRATPARRWESRHFIAEFDLYEYWRPLPADRGRPTRDAHPAPP
jgi:hypothetical protein